MVDGCGWWVGRSAGVACWLVWFVGWLVCITHQRANQPTEHTNKQPNQPTHHQASQPAQSNHANHTTQPSHTPTPTNHKHERTRSELRARSQCRETDRDLGATWACRGVPPAPIATKRHTDHHRHPDCVLEDCGVAKTSAAPSLFGLGFSPAEMQ